MEGPTRDRCLKINTYRITLPIDCENLTVLGMITYEKHKRMYGSLHAPVTGGSTGPRSPRRLEPCPWGHRRQRPLATPVREGDKNDAPVEPRHPPPRTEGSTLYKIRVRMGFPVKLGTFGGWWGRGDRVIKSSPESLILLRGGSVLDARMDYNSTLRSC